LSAPRDVPEPFYIAQVLENDAAEREFTIQWYKPSARSLQRTSKFHQHSFREELVEVDVNNRQVGGRVRLGRWTQIIQYDVVHLGFSKLRETGDLPAEVLRLLRTLGLVDGTVRRN
jgi:hypothetical protein